MALVFVSAATGQSTKAPHPSGESLPVASVEGARCIIQRDGEKIADFFEPGTGDKGTVRFVFVDTASHDDITVTCSKDGYEKQSKTLSIVAGRWIYVSPPCEPPENSTREEIQAYCTQYYAAKTENPTIMEYPEVVINLKRNRENKIR